MNLTTTYLDIQLRNPIIVSSSKLTDDPEKIRKCFDAGAGAVVLRSLFEEQIIAEMNTRYVADPKYFWYPKVADYVTKLSKEHGIDEYLRLIQVSKAQNPIPIIASINCISASEWTGFARQIEFAGADALELNISYFPMDGETTAEEIENRYVEIVKEVRKFTRLPIAVKIFPYFTNIRNITSRLVNAGADSLVLFNRYYQPDIDVERIKIKSGSQLSSAQETLSVMRWISLLNQQNKMEISASTGIYDSRAVIKHLLLGATTVQVCSTLFKNGIDYIETMLQELKLWMMRHNFESVDAFRGSMNALPELQQEMVRIHYLQKDFE